jgi:hypothetical protein
VVVVARERVSRGLRWGLLLTLVVLSFAVAWEAGAAAQPPRTPTSDPRPAPVVVSVRDGGFDWADAGVGAAAMLAVMLLAVGLAMAIRPRRSPASQRALSSAQREEP